VMVLNDGGPGGPGLGMPLRMRSVMGAVGARYDLIGVDPRFVGRSTPLDCDWPVGSGIWSAGADRQSFDRATDLAEDLANRCAAAHPDLLPYATTRNTARDLDLIRAALGEQKMSYLGYSYGTYLGAVYLQMFPGRADRVVLDGPGDPELFGPQLLRTTGSVNEAALRAWAQWAASRDATYHFGRTADQVIATVARIYRVSHQHPLQVGDYAVPEYAVPALVFASLGSDQDAARASFAELVGVLSEATKGPVAAPPAIEEMLEAVLTGSVSANASAQMAILCGDRAAPRQPATYWADIQRHRQAEPFTASITRNLLPCAFWPNDPVEQPTRVDNDVPALIVAATGDPRTTYPMAKALHRDLSGSRLITLQNARKHGIYGEYGNQCVDNLVNDYLAGNVLPAVDAACSTVRRGSAPRLLEGWIAGAGGRQRVLLAGALSPDLVDDDDDDADQNEEQERADRSQASAEERVQGVPRADVIEGVVLIGAVDRDGLRRHLVHRVGDDVVGVVAQGPLLGDRGQLQWDVRAGQILRLAVRVQHGLRGEDGQSVPVELHRPFIDRGRRGQHDPDQLEGEDSAHHDAEDEEADRDPRQRLTVRLGRTWVAARTWVLRLPAVRRLPWVLGLSGVRRLPRVLRLPGVLRPGVVGHA
jgi:pimeloyl-ACP methyl ester carboxylesterase